MAQLTPRQEEFLLFFAARSGYENSISEAALRFDVTKTTVSVVSSALVRTGMIVKSDLGEIALTPAGRRYILPKLQSARALAVCLTSRLGLLPYAAENEARKMAVYLQPETIQIMLQSWNNTPSNSPDLPADHSDPVQPSSLFSWLPCGVYPVFFQVCKPGQKELSMGDRGFQKPAKLIRNTNKSLFLLYPAQISYRMNHRKSIDGSLARLWYLKEGLWHEIQLSQDNGCILPAEVLTYQNDDTGPIGTIRIRVRATVGLRNMPESEADLVFFLSDFPPEIPSP